MTAMLLSLGSQRLESQKSWGNIASRAMREAVSYPSWNARQCERHVGMRKYKFKIGEGRSSLRFLIQRYDPSVGTQYWLVWIQVSVSKLVIGFDMDTGFLAWPFSVHRGGYFLTSELRVGFPQPFKLMFKGVQTLASLGQLADTDWIVLNTTFTLGHVERRP
jgi:hypothetical protein